MSSSCVSMYFIIYATPLYTGHRDDCSPLPFQVIQVSVVNFSRVTPSVYTINCSLTSTLLARRQNMALNHVLFTDISRLTVLCARSRDPHVTPASWEQKPIGVEITDKRLCACHVTNTHIYEPTIKPCRRGVYYTH